MSQDEPDPATPAAEEDSPAEADGAETYTRPERPAPPPKSGILTLLGQLLPPLLLAPLIVIPFDFITILLWLVAAICLLVSIVSAVIRLLTIGFGAASQRRERLLRLIRPMLTIVVACTVHVCVQHSIYLAEHEVAVLASSIQSEGRRAGTYPEALPGWSAGTEFGNTCSRRSFGWTTDYTATYVATEARDGFTLSLRLDKDTSLILRGGLQTELEASVANYMIGNQQLSMEELLDR